VEPHEIHEIAEAIPGHDHHRTHSAEAEDRFRKFTGIYVGVVAMLLAIATLGGANATKAMLSANISASDTYAYYQTKVLRQAVFETALNQMGVEVGSHPDMPPSVRNNALQWIKTLRQNAARAASDPKSGHGQKELIVQARHWEEKRDRAEARNRNFEFAGALYQIAIVLGSVSIVAASRRLLGLSGVLATIGTLLMLNGYFLLLPMPFG
jgi:uncharacterized membrane protein YkgB